MARKQKKPKWEKQGTRWVAKLGGSVEEQILARRRADREAAKEAGTLGQGIKTGAHGGGKRERTRRDRHSDKQRMRQGGYDE